MEKSFETTIDTVYTGIQKLLCILSEGSTKDVFKIESHAKPNKVFCKKSKDVHDNLAKLANILESYINKKKGLPYIGFIGAFDSGKSATINSLTGAKEGETGYREEGNQPETIHISILTSLNNAMFVYPFKDSNEAKKEIVPANLPILDHFFIIDTPGSGNTKRDKNEEEGSARKISKIDEELVKNFLPICDLIIYCFMAPMGYTIMDDDFLKLIYSKLHFVPKKFVITQLDKECVEENIGAFWEDNNSHIRQKAEKLVREIIGRINSDFFEYEPGCEKEDFFFVTNTIYQFGIRELREYIVNFSSPENQSVRESVHKQKIAFFLEAGLTIKAYYLKEIDEHIKNITQLISDFKKRQKDYDLRANKFLEEFEEIEHADYRLSVEMLESPISEVVNIRKEYENTVENYEPYRKMQEEFNDSFERYSNDCLEKIKQDFVFTLKNGAKHYLLTFSNADFQDNTELCKNNLFANNENELPKNIAKSVEGLLNGCFASLNTKRTAMIERVRKDIAWEENEIRDLMQKLGKSNLLEAHTNIYRNLKKSIENIVLRFEGQIIFLRTGFLAAGNNERINDLGIYVTLDNFANPKSSIDGEILKNHVKIIRFFDDYKENFLNLRNDYFELCEEILRRLETLKRYLPEQKNTRIKGKSKQRFENMAIEISERIHKEFKSFCFNKTDFSEAKNRIKKFKIQISDEEKNKTDALDTEIDRKKSELDQKINIKTTRTDHLKSDLKSKIFNLKLKWASIIPSFLASLSALLRCDPYAT